MSLNPILRPGTKEPFRMEGEFLILSRAQIDYEVVTDLMGTFTGFGNLILSSSRLIIITLSHKNSSSTSTSFEFPLGSIIKESYNQPLFRMNYWQATCRPIFGSMWGEARIKIWLRQKQSGTLIPTFFALLDSLRGNENRNHSPIILNALFRNELNNVFPIDDNDPSVFYEYQPEAIQWPKQMCQSAVINRNNKHSDFGIDESIDNQSKEQCVYNTNVNWRTSNLNYNNNKENEQNKGSIHVDQSINNNSFVNKSVYQSKYRSPYVPQSNIPQQGTNAINNNMGQGNSNVIHTNNINNSSNNNNIYLNAIQEPSWNESQIPQAKKEHNVSNVFLSQISQGNQNNKSDIIQPSYQYQENSNFQYKPVDYKYKEDGNNNNNNYSNMIQGNANQFLEYPQNYNEPFINNKNNL